MYTIYPQVVLLGVSLLTLAVLIWLARKVYTPYGELKAQARVIELLKLDLADLADRFNNWQKRDGMRQARAVKETDGNLKLELEKLALAQQLTQPVNTRASLRAKFRGST